MTSSLSLSREADTALDDAWDTEIDTVAFVDDAADIGLEGAAEVGLLDCGCVDCVEPESDEPPGEYGLFVGASPLLPLSLDVRYPGRAAASSSSSSPPSCSAACFLGGFHSGSGSRVARRSWISCFSSAVSLISTCPSLYSTPVGSRPPTANLDSTFECDLHVASLPKSLAAETLLAPLPARLNLPAPEERLGFRRFLGSVSGLGDSAPEEWAAPSLCIPEGLGFRV